MPCPVSYHTRLVMLSGRLRQARPTANVSFWPLQIRFFVVFIQHKDMWTVSSRSRVPSMSVLDASQSHVTSISGLRFLRRGVSRVGRGPASNFEHWKHNLQPHPRSTTSSPIVTLLLRTLGRIELRILPSFGENNLKPTAPNPSDGLASCISTSCSCHRTTP